MSTRYYVHYKNIISSDILLKCNLSSIHNIPKVTSVHLHTSPGGNPEQVIASGLCLILLSGQRPGWTRAHRAIAGFKLRKDQLLGCRVSIHKSRLWNLLPKLLDLAFTRRRDYIGLSLQSMNSYGQWGFGCKDLLMFPELEHLWQYTTGVGGLDINFNCTSTDPKISLLFWSGLQIPVK